MSAVRSKCSGGQYGEAQRPLGLREVQGRKQPIRRAVPVRRPYSLRGVLDLAPTPPTRAGHPPVRCPHPHHQAPQRRPRSPSPPRTSRLTPRLPAVHSILPSTILQPERGLRTFSKTGTL
ncbi:uncharacterized protein [Triticum aestivum]|uniref:uncharacterized protein isoform X3 n=1 Tax=Triticum aestivum TaxID=4565 RepID=UPI001D00FFD9|nr:uncharacterized protein LOC123102844 isoform X3 [Triticum aestivum]